MPGMAGTSWPSTTTSFPMARTSIETDRAVWPGDRTARLLALFGALAPLLFLIACTTAATLTTPGYSHVSQSLSQLAATGAPHPWIMASGFVVYGLLCAPLGYGLFRGLGRDRLALIVFGLVSLYWGVTVVAGIFRVDGPEMPATWVGAVHYAATLSLPIVLVLAAIAMALSCRFNPRWHNFPRVSLVLGAFAFLFGVLFIIGAWDSLKGVWERGFFVFALIWIETVAVRLYLESKPRLAT